MNTAAISTVLEKLKGRIPAVVCAILAVVAFVYTYARGAMEATLVESETALTSEINQIDANTRAAAELANQLETLNQSVESIEARLFQASARAINTNFFYQMEELADIRVAQVRQGSVIAPEGNREYAAIEYTLVAEGTFTDLVQFLYNLRTVNAFIEIRTFDIRGASGGGATRDAANLTLSCTIRVLAQKET